MSARELIPLEASGTPVSTDMGEVQGQGEAVGETRSSTTPVVMDDRALVWHLHKQRPRLISFFVSRGATTSDAEELTSDTFITLWERRAFIQTGKEIVFLFGIARNKLLNYRRKRNRAALRELPMQAVEYDLKELFEAVTPEKVAFEAEIRDILAAAMTRLSMRQRQCLCIRHFEHRTIAETAREMEISRPSARTLEKRALAQMQKHLIKHYRIG